MSSNNVQFQQPMSLPQQMPLPQMTVPVPQTPLLVQGSLPQCINTSSIMNYITQYWWVIVALILAFLYYRQSINKAKKEKEDVVQTSSM
jgi:hypothetical protein